MSLTADAPSRQRKPRFHTLAVSAVRPEGEDAVSVAFAVPESLREAYAFAPGQYLTLEAELGGERIRRAYSICSAPGEDLRIGVRRVQGGAMSDWINTSLTPGDQISVMTPTGRFGLMAPATGPRLYAAFAAGSGITPVLSIVTAILAAEKGSRVFLFYGNRNSAGIMFRESLAALKDRYRDRFALYHVLSREEQEIPLLHGRLDAAKAERLLRAAIGAVPDHLFICGPEGMIGEIETAARAVGVTAEAIHVERFVSALEGVPRPAPSRATERSDRPGMPVEIVLDGNRRRIAVPDGLTVVDAALEAGIDLPYACKGGMCSTCRARVVSGRVEMAMNYALTKAELEAGFVLTCQSRPVAPGTVLDYDAM